MTLKVLDLFAGPGGWDVGARQLGLDPLGIEYDDAACATREAAGLRTVQQDVSLLDPSEFQADLLIASPPCQAWSMAGKRKGHEDIDLVYQATRGFAVDLNLPGIPYQHPDYPWADERSPLVMEPLRWVLELRPAYVAWEQVPPVLDYWRFCAEILRDQGYSVWTGILSAERYGVPQTRKRAILMASLNGPVEPPRPTHQAYTSGEPAWSEPMASLEGELKPWVSMAEALGWTAEIPAPTVTGGGTDNGGPEPFGRGAPAITSKARSDEWEYDTRYGGFGADANLRGGAEPAPTVTAQGLAKGRDVIRRKYVNGNQENAAVRDEGEPAPTLHFGAAMNDVRWLKTRSDREERKEAGAGNVPRPTDAPAPTVDTGIRQAHWTEEQPAPTVVGTRRSKDGPLIGRQLPEGEGENIGGKNWTEGRPATTVAGDPRVAQPGHKRDEDNPDSPGRMQDAVRVTIQEASILQGFPPDYPWQGSRSKQFQQIGNAVPPPLARAILEQLVGAVELQEAA